MVAQAVGLYVVPGFALVGVGTVGWWLGRGLRALWLRTKQHKAV